VLARVADGARPARRCLLALTALALVLLAAACGDGESAEPPEGSRAVEIAGPEGSELSARELGHGDVAVVLAHGASTNMTSWYAPMPAMAGAGYRVVAFDSRGVGDSTGAASTAVADRVADIGAVVGHLRDTGATKVVVMGSSLGAHAALVAAEAGDVDGVVGVSPAGVPPGADAITVPAFFVAAEGDTGPAANARTLGRELGRPAEIVSGSIHGADLFADHPEATRALVAFLEEAVPARGAS
jgi:pimeloyl-ACP methyl ester carboxylesterase